MSQVFHTTRPVPRDFNPAAPFVVYVENENDMRTAAQAFADEHAAYRAKGIKEGDTVYITVCYAGGRFKPGNVRNDPRRVHYDTIDSKPYVDLKR